MKRAMLVLAALALLLGGVGQTKAGFNLITNGGFETGNFAGWNLSGNPGFISITSDAHSGNYAASFGAVGSPTFLMQQSIATTVGDSYTLDFWLRNDGGPINLFEAQFNGSSLVTLNNSQPFSYTELRSAI